MELRCGNCGNIWEGGNILCPNCGKVGTPVQPGRDNPTIAPSISLSAQQRRHPIPERPEEHAKRLYNFAKWLTIGSIVLACVLVLVAVIVDCTEFQDNCTAVVLGSFFAAIIIGIGFYIAHLFRGREDSMRLRKCLTTGSIILAGVVFLIGLIIFISSSEYRIYHIIQTLILSVSIAIVGLIVAHSLRRRGQLLLSPLTPQQRRDNVVEQYYRWSAWITYGSIVLAIADCNIDVAIFGFFTFDQIDGKAIAIPLLQAGSIIAGGLLLALYLRGRGELIRTLGGIEDNTAPGQRALLRERQRPRGRSRSGRMGRRWS